MATQINKLAGQIPRSSSLRTTDFGSEPMLVSLNWLNPHLCLGLVKIRKCCIPQQLSGCLAAALLQPAMSIPRLISSHHILIQSPLNEHVVEHQFNNDSSYQTWGPGGHNNRIQQPYLVLVLSDGWETLSSSNRLPIEQGICFANMNSPNAPFIAPSKPLDFSTEGPSIARQCRWITDDLVAKERVDLRDACFFGSSCRSIYIVHYASLLCDHLFDASTSTPTFHPNQSFRV